MTKPFRNVVVTGATGGIGAAIVRELTEPGRTFLLFGRDATRMEALVGDVEMAGGKAVAVLCDLLDTAQIDAAIAAFDADHPIDLVMTCAACKYGNVEGVEAPDELRRVIDVNVTGTMNVVQSCLQHMRARVSGRIALFSSLAAMSPQPDLLSYSASKAAISAYATALRRSIRRSGIGVSLVLPGFVDTEMTRRHIGPTPLLMSAEDASRVIVAGIERGKRTIAFPRRLAMLSWLERLAPAFIADAVHDRLRAEVVSEKRFGNKET